MVKTTTAMADQADQGHDRRRHRLYRAAQPHQAGDPDLVIVEPGARHRGLDALGQRGDVGPSAGAQADVD